MIDNEAIARITQKIRALRIKKNLTIQELANRTNVSKGLLSKIENARTLPSLPVFVTLVQSLEVSLKEFFEDMSLTNGKEYVVIRKEQYTPMTREGRMGFNYLHIFSQHVSAATLEVVLLTLEPGAKGRPTTTDGYELKYLISGKCDYQINNEMVSLEEGDTIYFDASVPHLPVNTSKRPAMMLVLYFISPKG
jgi:transcriptional regulator with XRE-family HTH domain